MQQRAQKSSITMSSATQIRPSGDFDKTREELTNKYLMDSASFGNQSVKTSDFLGSSSLSETRQEVRATFEQLQ